MRVIVLHRLLGPDSRLLYSCVLLSGGRARGQGFEFPQHPGIRRVADSNTHVCSGRTERNGTHRVGGGGRYLEQWTAAAAMASGRPREEDGTSSLARPYPEFARVDVAGPKIWWKLERGKKWRPAGEAKRSLW